MNFEIFKNDLNIDLSQKQIEQFIKYYNFLIEFNKHTNLTRITDFDDCLIKHFFDSISIIKTFDISKIQSLCDLGSGAGFPSIPLKIVFPHLKITIVDSSLKRVNFLIELTNLLMLDYVEVIHDRAEIFASKNNNKFDLTTARALGSIAFVLELGIPITKVGGYCLLFKGPNYEDELANAESIVKKIGCKLEKTVMFNLPNDYGVRVHLLYNKQKHVLGYPRSIKEIKSKTI